MGRCPGGGHRPGAGQGDRMTQTMVRDAAAESGLTAQVQALEARKALLAGTVAALEAPDDLTARLFEAVLADPGARWWPFDLARVHLLYRGAAAHVAGDHPVAVPPAGGAGRLRAPRRGQ